MDVDFDKGNGLVPVIVQDAHTDKVLMLGYMNAEALAKTRAEGRVTFYSRSKNRLWTKGETSGNFLTVVDIRPDCDRDALLIKAHPAGVVCHTGADTCFGETNAGQASFLNHLQGVIHQRRQQPSQQSYVSSLLAKGINKVAQKVGEEAVELVIEAKDDDAALFRNEAADLLFHLLVLLEAKDTPLDDVIDVLRARHQPG